MQSVLSCITNLCKISPSLALLFLALLGKISSFLAYLCKNIAIFGIVVQNKLPFFLVFWFNIALNNHL